MIQCFWLQILKIWLEISPGSNFDLFILLQTGINAGQRSDKSMTRRVEAKKGGVWANLWAAIFSKPKGICNWFFLCVHSTYRWTYSMNMSKIWGGHLTPSGSFRMEWPCFVFVFLFFCFLIWPSPWHCLVHIKWALDKYNIHLFIPYSIEDFKLSQLPKFSADSANVFSFYEVFCEQHHLQSAP